MINPTEISVWLAIAASVIGSFGAVAMLFWTSSQWLSKQFSATRHLIDEKIEKLEQNILEKLEYHEKHDDQRFESLQNRVWDIQVRNASKDGPRAP